MKLNRFLALLLAAVLLGGIPALADAEEAPLPEGLFALGEASEYGEVTIEDPAVSTAPAAAPMLRSALFRSASIQSAGAGTSTRYDPRESGGYLPPVRTQGSWNTCWAVAAVGAAGEVVLSALLTVTAAEPVKSL